MARTAILVSLLIGAAAVLTAQVRTADPIKRGLKLSDFPRTVKVSDNVYAYEDFHAGDEKFTTTSMFVVTPEGVLVADGQGDAAATKGLVDAVAKVTPKPIRYVVIGSDHGDHTGGNAAFPAGVIYVIHPASKAILDRAAAGRSGRARRAGSCLAMRSSSRRTRSPPAAKPIEVLPSAARIPVATSAICRVRRSCFERPS